MEDLFMTRNGMDIYMCTQSELFDILSKNQPYELVLYKPYVNGTFSSRTVNTIEELEDCLENYFNVTVTG